MREFDNISEGKEGRALDKMKFMKSMEIDGIAVEIK